MSATIVVSKNTTRIGLSGEFDYSTQDELKQAFSQALDTDTEEIEIDLEQTTFIDSSFLRTLLKLRETAARNGKSLTIIHCSENILEIFAIGGFDQIFNIR